MSGTVRWLIVLGNAFLDKERRSCVTVGNACLPVGRTLPIFRRGFGEQPDVM